MTPAVEFRDVSRHFGDVLAVDSLDLSIREGEFFALLGPSGSGKTTCLRLIAGFDTPTSGQISIFNEAVQNVPPYRRNVNTVFQDYALFPHMSVVENVAYALKVRKHPKAVQQSKALEALDLVRLTGLADRRPAQLSGGQRQRVALARALVAQPRVLLLDEPLGALDLKLREDMQEELKTLQRNLGITFVFVTHDQTEALSMADRVAIFNHGQLQQLGTPEQVYQQPVSEFVARFVGSSNVLSVDELAALGISAQAASLRPEAIKIVKQNGYQARVNRISFLGASLRLQLQVQISQDSASTVSLVALVDHDSGEYKVGDTLRVDWSHQALHLMSATDSDLNV